MTRPASLIDGLTQFNQGDFYGCHDTLEAIWLEADSVDKPFYQGLLQIAVALYHLGNHNWRGAAILLGEGMRRLEPYEPQYYGVAVSDLLDRAADWLQALQASGPEQVVSVATALHQGTSLGNSPPLPPPQIHWD